MSNLKNKKLKLVALSILFVIFCAFLTACAGSNRITNFVTAYPTTILNVTIDKQPKTVASLSSDIARMLTALGYQEKLVGYPTDFVDTAIGEDKKIGTAMKPDYDKIGELAPEIIFTNVPLPQVDMEKLSQVGIKVVVMPVVNDIDSLKARYVDLICIMEGQIEANYKGIKRVDELKYYLEEIEKIIPQPKKSFIYIASLDPIIATGDTFEGCLLSYVGDNLAQNMTGYSVEKEQLTAFNPDIIFYSSDIDPENIKQSENFAHMIKENNLYPIDNQDLMLHNDKVYDVIGEIAGIVYPTTSFEIAKMPEPVIIRPKKWYDFFSKNDTKNTASNESSQTTVE